MSKVIKIKKGLNIKLKGSADKILSNTKLPDTFAIKPTDFPSLTPKLSVKPEDTVKAGEALFYDKYNPEIKFTSPVSGKVLAVNRGKRRRILNVVIQRDKELIYKDFGKHNPKEMSREDIKKIILDSGAWAFIIQRPYSIIADPKDNPKAIFISTFDTSPLAPDYDFISAEETDAFQKGIDVLTKLTDGKVHISKHEEKSSNIFDKTEGVEKHRFTGPHPAGNVGIQIHHISPINKGDIYWTINPVNVIIIGRLFQKGIFDASKIIALTGASVQKPQYYKTILGANLSELTGQQEEGTNNRYISGNVLTGTKIEKDGYLGFYDNQITIIPEGNHFEFLGWLNPGLNKYSFSSTFLSSVFPKKEYNIDTNYNGGERAFVVSGQYEKVLPMDILPVHLLKAILAEDIDKMEELGIYEVAEEDFALCEFICTSKIEVQEIIRKGINIMLKEMS